MVEANRAVSWRALPLSAVMSVAEEANAQNQGHSANPTVLAGRETHEPTKPATDDS